MLSVCVKTGCCYPFKVSDSVIVDSLFNFSPIGLWGFCVWSLFHYLVPFLDLQLS